MDATMEDPRQRAFAIGECASSLVTAGAARRTDDKRTVLLALQSLDPARGWHRIDGILYSVFATDDPPPQSTIRKDLSSYARSEGSS